MQGYNPIRSINGINNLPAPDKFEWGLQDVSKEGSGRNEAITMTKGRIGQIKQLRLEWQDVTISNGAKILQAFNPEYVTIDYLDAMKGAFISKEFFVGDRSAVLFDTKAGKWSSIGFDVTTKEGTYD